MRILSLTGYSSSGNNNSVSNKNCNTSENYMKSVTIAGITYFTCIWKDCVYKSQIKFDVLRHIRTHTGLTLILFINNILKFISLTFH